MAKDFSAINDISPAIGDRTGADCGSDLADDTGVDLNADGGLAKATVMSCEAPLPEDYSADANVRPPDSAIYTETPAPKTPEDWAAEMGATIREGGPAEESHPDSLIVQEPVAEQHPPPPESNESNENDANKTT